MIDFLKNVALGGALLLGVFSVVAFAPWLLLVAIFLGVAWLLGFGIRETF